MSTPSKRCRRAKCRSASKVRRTTATILLCTESRRRRGWCHTLCVRACVCVRVFACAAKNGVVIATEKKVSSILVDEESVEKIALYTGNVGMCIVVARS
ncbi:hypothetical protein EON67_08375 [archaeon]|nr:MAG: hypothetical protein EON67_08375 [archaeon]